MTGAMYICQQLFTAVLEHNTCPKLLTEDSTLCLRILQPNLLAVSKVYWNKRAASNLL